MSNFGDSLGFPCNLSIESLEFFLEQLMGSIVGETLDCNLRVDRFDVDIDDKFSVVVGLHRFDRVTCWSHGRRTRHGRPMIGKHMNIYFHVSSLTYVYVEQLCLSFIENKNCAQIDS